MKSKTLIKLSLLLVFVAACSTPQGDFCLSASQLPIKDKTVDYLVENDDDLARGIASHNANGAEACGWESFDMTGGL